MMMPQDQQLLDDLCSSKDKRSQAEFAFFRQYQYFINEGCHKYNLNEQDGFSAYSDAVLSVIINIRQQKFDGRSSLKTYLYQVFSHKCVDLLRHNTTNKEQANQALALDDAFHQLPDAARSVVEKMITQQQIELTRQKLAELGDKCRTILQLFEEGLTDKQIAGELNYQNAAVAKTTRLRCLEKLREKVTAALRNEK
jgi:RNA polymerase sigma factor (sigma-70 family)